MSHLTKPANLPVPVDDGACNHLAGFAMPDLELSATSGSLVNVSKLPGLSVIFCYPRTGAPGEVIPPEWNDMPGARGCTPQACSFRDAIKDLKAAGLDAVYGLSTQDTPYQQEAKGRLQLPYDLLSDEKLDFVKALSFPTHDWKGGKLTKRATLAMQDGKIVKYWYPVFPTEKSAEQVLTWLREENGNRAEEK